MHKELKQCKSIEELKATDKVKKKASEYASKYMKKFEREYKRSPGGDDWICQERDSLQVVWAPTVVCDVIYQLIIVTCIVTLASKATAARKLINVYHVRMHYTAMV